MTWQRGSFICDVGKGPTRVDGFVYAGIGIFDCNPDAPASSRWCIIHIGSGFVLCWIVRRLPSTVKELAAEIAELGDWDFESIEGWRNRDPALQERFTQFIEENWNAIDLGNGVQPSPEQTKAINAARAN